MIVDVDAYWELVGNMPDGTDVTMVNVKSEGVLIGRIYDVDEYYIAEYLDVRGDVATDNADDYYSALQLLTQKALARRKTLH